MYITFLLLYALQCAHHQNLVSTHYHTVDSFYSFALPTHPFPSDNYYSFHCIYIHLVVLCAALA